jgi:C4-type Zn-finger protein
MKYCPKCKAPMELIIEKSPGPQESIRISYFYKCKACGTRVDDAVLLMKKVEGGYECHAVEYVG